MVQVKFFLTQHPCLYNGDLLDRKLAHACIFLLGPHSTGSHKISQILNQLQKCTNLDLPFLKTQFSRFLWKNQICQFWTASPINNIWQKLSGKYLPGSQSPNYPLFLPQTEAKYHCQLSYYYVSLLLQQIEEEADMLPVQVREFFLSLIFLAQYGTFLGIWLFAFASPFLRLIRLPADITDTKQKLRRTLQMCRMLLFVDRTRRNHKTATMSSGIFLPVKQVQTARQTSPLAQAKKVSLGSTAFVKFGQASTLLFISIYNMLKMSRLPPTFAISSDFCFPFEEISCNQ